MRRAYAPARAVPRRRGFAETSPGLGDRSAPTTRIRAPNTTVMPRVGDSAGSLRCFSVHIDIGDAPLVQVGRLTRRGPPRRLVRPSAAANRWAWRKCPVRTAHFYLTRGKRHVTYIAVFVASPRSTRGGETQYWRLPRDGKPGNGGYSWQNTARLLGRRRSSSRPSLRGTVRSRRSRWGRH